jgi:hypothetical protein
MKSKSKKMGIKNLGNYRGRYEFKDKDKMLEDIHKKRREKRYYK